MEIRNFKTQFNCCIHQIMHQLGSQFFRVLCQVSQPLITCSKLAMKTLELCEILERCLGCCADDDMRVDPLMSHHRLENDHKRQCICQIRHEKLRVVHPVFQICLFNKCLFISKLIYYILFILYSYHKYSKNHVDLFPAGLAEKPSKGKFLPKYFFLHNLFKSLGKKKLFLNGMCCSLVLFQSLWSFLILLFCAI